MPFHSWPPRTVTSPRSIASKSKFVDMSHHTLNSVDQVDFLARAGNLTGRSQIELLLDIEI